MKRKFFIGGAALLFAAATLFNMSFLTGNNAGDASLESIAVMARAQYAGEKVPGWTNADEKEGYICNIPGGVCDVSAQL